MKEIKRNISRKTIGIIEAAFSHTPCSVPKMYGDWVVTTEIEYKYSLLERLVRKIFGNKTNVK